MRYRFSVCICTRNRPDDLLRALKSVEQTEWPVHEVIVSDDSTDARTEKLVRSRFPEAVYLAGPRKGLSANRNYAIRAVTGSHVLFMDDDVMLAKDFFFHITGALKAGVDRFGHKMIVTGLENRNGHLIYPHEQSFLGFQQRSYRNGEALKTIVINSTVFPVFLFREIRFDEQLIYGYEEVDIATRAFRSGYAIRLAEKAVNFHYPSAINRDDYRPHLEASRLYATLKRYRYTEGKPFKALSFLMIAYPHSLRHGFRRKGIKGFADSFRAIGSAMKFMMNHARRS